jgi:outer membrane protein TolC
LALSAKLYAANKARRYSYTDYLPSLLGVFTPLYQNPSSLVQPAWSWQLQLQLTVPLFDGGLRYGLFHARAALSDGARAELDGALAQGRSELLAGFAALHHDERALESAQSAAQLARRAVEIAELSYRLGATTNLELLDAQRRARDAETAAVMAEDALHRARLDVQAAAGVFP